MCQVVECHAHHVAVAVLDAADDLLEEVPRLVLQQTPLLHDVVKQLPGLPQTGCYESRPCHLEHQGRGRNRAEILEVAIGMTAAIDACMLSRSY